MAAVREQVELATGGDSSIAYQINIGPQPVGSLTERMPSLFIASPEIPNAISPKVAVTAGQQDQDIKATVQEVQFRSGATTDTSPAFPIALGVLVAIGLVWLAMES